MRPADFDNPVSPADDERDNVLNVTPHAQFVGNSLYEFLPELSRGTGAAATDGATRAHDRRSRRRAQRQPSRRRCDSGQSTLQHETLWYRMVAGGTAPRYVRLRPQATLAAGSLRRTNQALPDEVNGLIAKTTVEILTLRPTMSYGLGPGPSVTTLSPRIAACLAATWFIWGSTYLAIKFALVSFPPFFQNGTRFLLAGSMLLAWARWRRQAMPTLAQWRNALVVGSLMLAANVGGVAYAEQTLASGLVVAFIAIVPALITVASLPFGIRPTRMEVIGIVLGFCGVLLLVRGDSVHELSHRSCSGSSPRRWAGRPAAF